MVTTASPTANTTPASRPWVAHYEAGVPVEIAFPEVSVDQLLRISAEREPDADALIFFGARTTFRVLDQAADRFAHVLTAMGVAKGDRVSLHLPTSPAFVIAFMGTLRAGAIAVPMNPLWVERELGLLFGQARPKVSVTLDLLVPRLRAVPVQNGTGGPGRLVVAGIQDSLPAPIRWLYPLKARREGRWHPVPDAPESPRFFRLLRDAPASRFSSAAIPDDIAVLQPTGGTTGTPKTAMLTHRNLVANAYQVMAWNPSVLGRHIGVLSPLPFFHIYGLTVDMNYAMVVGATLILLPRFDPEQVFSAISKYRPQLFPAAPIMYQTLARHPKAAKHDLRSIEVCISGASPLTREVQDAFETITGARVVEGYGLTEASPVTHCNPSRGERRIGTIGVPFPSTDARIVDPASGGVLAPGEVGELEVAGPQVMAGYWERPEETAAVLHDGWLRTGDMATMSDDGYFTIVDRRKDVLLVGGLNVYPREVEEVLLSHPAVREAAVVGRPEERRGEVPQAFVVREPGASVDRDELLEHCRANLARYKVPVVIEFRDELPKSMIGKVLRKELRAAVQRGEPGATEASGPSTEEQS
jgi:long-chain acyl-CoA synthetase